MLTLALPVIGDSQRQPEEQLWHAFEGARPRILGALLDGVVMGLRRVGSTHLQSYPRMADFARWAVAAEPAWPWPSGSFLEAYEKNRRGTVEARLDGDPLAALVRSLALPWDGTATDLLKLLNEKTGDEVKRQKGWFQQPRQLSDALWRLAPHLRRVGVNVERLRRTAAGRLIRLTPARSDDAACDEVRHDSETSVIHRHSQPTRNKADDEHDGDDAVSPTSQDTALTRGGGREEARERFTL
jgi:hypothetical protein